MKFIEFTTTTGRRVTINIDQVSSFIERDSGDDKQYVAVNVIGRTDPFAIAMTYDQFKAHIARST